MKTPELKPSESSWSVNYLRLLANGEVEPHKIMLDYVADYLAMTIDSVWELMKEKNELKSRLAQVERENKAMLHDMARYTMCGSCKHFADDGKCPQKDECVYGEIGRFEWRGVCAENTEEDEHHG